MTNVTRGHLEMVKKAIALTRGHLEIAKMLVSLTRGHLGRAKKDYLLDQRAPGDS